MFYPSFSKFKFLKNKFRIVPFIQSFSFPAEDGFALFKSIAEQIHPCFFLDGAASRRSYFPLSPPIKIFTAPSLIQAKKCFADLQKWMDEHPAPILSRFFPEFLGGAVGTVSYDCGRIFESGWKSNPASDPLKFPFLFFGIYHDLICLDSKTKRAFVISCLDVEKIKNKSSVEIYQEQKNKLMGFLNQIKSKKLIDCRASDSLNVRYPLFTKKSNYIQQVKKIKKYIAQGDVYQVNLSQRFSVNLKGLSLDFYERLRSINPSPYSCYFDLPDFEVMSCSPELLLKKRGLKIESRPIAGTRPRGKNKSEDSILEDRLMFSEKERAEHIMLVDLERNDLGKVCVAGSVRVTQNSVVEKYSHVMHIVSHVIGILKSKENFFTALQSVFPGGTITGCPKVRCMQIIDEMESVARGPFYGSAGWIAFSGDGEFNLLIRTAIRKSVKGKNNAPIYFQTGSGIVSDSISELEYQESLYKAEALLKALGINLTK